MINERMSSAGKYFLCSCGYDSRKAATVTGPAGRRLPVSLTPQASTELLSQLVFLEAECKKMQGEIYSPDKLEAHINILPKIYENLKIILK